MSELLSVILPVKDGMPYIVEAVESILQQTFHDFRLLVIDDGSSDDTLTYLNSLRDSRLEIFRNPGAGLVSALNFGISQSSSTFIARMDADDICLPSRFAAQISGFREYTKVSVISSNVERIDISGRSLGTECEVSLTGQELIDGLTLRRTMKPLIHPSVMFHAEALIRAGGYRSFTYAEDKDLWLRLAVSNEFVRLPEVLLKYRITPGGISRSKRLIQAVNSDLACVSYLLSKKLGYFPDFNDSHLTCARKILENAHRELEPSELAFENFKSAVRSGDFMAASVSGLSGLATQRLRFFPSYRRVLKARALDLAASRTEE